MPVDTTHYEYDENFEDWTLLEDSLKGERAIKVKGDVYLPRPLGLKRDVLPGDDKSEWQAYLERASYEEAVRRTVEGLTGLIFRKPPEDTGLEGAMDAFLQNATMTGVPFSAFVKRAMWRDVGLGRHGVLCEPADNRLRAYVKGYKAEDITNWRYRNVGGVEIPDQVILRERVAAPSEDGFGSRVLEQYRVLELDGAGKLVRTIYRESERHPGEFKPFGDPVEPKRGEERIGFIPFVPLGPVDLEFRVDRSPVLGIARLAISAYRTSADLNHALHLSGMPMICYQDENPENTQRTIEAGSHRAMALAKGCTSWILAVDANQFAGLQNREEYYVARMAAHGARLLEASKRAAESGEALQIRQSGEQATLASIAETGSAAFERVLRWAAYFERRTENPEDPSITYRLNTDFVDLDMSPAELQIWMGALQAGEDVSGVPLEWIIHNLGGMEKLPPGWDADRYREWTERREQAAPRLAGAPLGRPVIVAAE